MNHYNPLFIWQIFFILDFLLKIYVFYLLWRNNEYNSTKKLLGFFIALLIPFLGSLMVLLDNRKFKINKLLTLTTFFAFSAFFYSCQKEEPNISPDAALNQKELIIKNRIIKKYNLVESKINIDSQTKGVVVENYETLERILDEIHSNKLSSSTVSLKGSSNQKKSLAPGAIDGSWSLSTFILSVQITVLGTSIDMHFPFNSSRKATGVMSTMSGFTALSSWNQHNGRVENTGELSGNYSIFGQLHYVLPAYGTVFSENKTITGTFNGKTNTGTFSW